jgi:hypothetical protein
MDTINQMIGPRDISRKVAYPALALVGFGGLIAAAGAVLADQRLRQVGATTVGAGVTAGGIGWAARDPQRQPYIERGFEEPELAEHRSIADAVDPAP